MTEYAIVADGLSKRYRIGESQDRYQTLRDSLTNGLKRLGRRSEPSYVQALDDVSFEVRQGEALGVIGRNGAGKSTLLKVLARITAPDSGRAELRGRLGSLLEVGTGFHPELTGRENIYLNGAILGMSKSEIERVFDDIVTFAEIDNFIDTPVKRYSSGMHLRLAFAVAAHLQPEILLLDEIFAVGDIEFHKKCMGRVEQVAEEGRTVLLVSHNMSTVKSLCKRAILLESGRLAASGPVDEVVAQYLRAGAQAADQAVADRDHDPRGGTQIRVRRVTLLDGVANSFSCYWREPIKIAVEIEVRELLEDVSLGAGIRMLDNTFLFTTHHDDEEHAPVTLEVGRYRVEFTFRNDLRPGLYKLHFGAHQRYSGLKNVCSVDPAVLEIVDFAREGSVPNPDNSGIVNGAAAWSLPERID